MKSPESAGMPIVDGTVAAEFEAVRSAFEANFAEHAEIGAACSVWWQGRQVVNIWGGWRNREAELAWERDSLVLMFSATKGMAAMAVAVAQARGLLDRDAKMAEYWPEFAQAGKASITVRQLLSHQAGLSAIDTPLPPRVLADLDQVAEACAKQEPLWEPGRRHGYHGLTLGFFEGELIRRVDPGHRSLGQFFADEIAKPLGVEFYIGLPGSVDASRIAAISSFKGSEMIFHLTELPWGMVLAYMWPGSITARSLSNPPAKSPGDYDRPEYRAVEFPAGGGIGKVADVAKLYSALAMGGAELGINSVTWEELVKPAMLPRDGDRDLVLKTHTAYSQGFMRPSPDFGFGSSPRALGAPGAGGAFAYADPDMELGFAYAPNKMGFSAYDDPRERALRTAVGECIRRLKSRV